MFIHAVLFEINPKEVSTYIQDCKMWARYAKKEPGYCAYFTMKRAGYKNHYLSVYKWRNGAYHKRFMGKLHDWLESKSKAKVRVLGYYNFKGLDAIR